MQLIQSEKHVTRKLDDLKVSKEVQSKSKLRSFNRGFYLRFNSADSQAEECTCVSRSIFPNALGLELFLMIDAKANPVSMELLTGGGMPVKHYEEPGKFLQEYLEFVLRKMPHVKNMLTGQSIFKLPFLRLTWMYEEIHFLIFSECYSPLINKKELIYNEITARHEISVFQDSKQFCFDGWIKYPGNVNLPSKAIAVFKPTHPDF